MKLLKKTIDVAAQTVTFAVKGYPAVVFHAEKAAPDNRIYAEYHGWTQVIGDTGAVGKTDDSGVIIPEAVRLATMHERIATKTAYFESGAANWTMGVVAVGIDVSLVTRAIQRVKGWGDSETESFIKTYAEKHYAGDRVELLKKLAKAEDTAKMILTIRSENIKPVLDADSELAELGKM